MTLMEVLVAMAVGATLAVAIYGSLAVAFRAQQAGLAAIEPVQAMDAALDILARDLHGAVLPLQGPLSGEFIVARDGTENATLSFRTTTGIAEVRYRNLRPVDVGVGTAVASEPERIGGDVIEVAYRLIGEGETRTLVRQVKRNLLAQVEADAEQQVLCEQVRRFEVRIYDGYNWLASWDSIFEDPPLPQALDVLIEVAPRDARQDDDHWFNPREGRRLTRLIPIPMARFAGQPGGGR